MVLRFALQYRNVHAPNTNCVNRCNAGRRSSQIPLRSQRITHPRRHPGTRNSFARPPTVITGTSPSYHRSSPGHHKSSPSHRKSSQFITKSSQVITGLLQVFTGHHQVITGSSSSHHQVSINKLNYNFY